MQNRDFELLLTLIDDMTESQKESLRNALDKEAAIKQIIGIIEAPLKEDRTCKHCGSSNVKKWGKAHDLQRYRCFDCRKTFNALTGTPMSGLHHREKWLMFAAMLGEGASIRKSAEQCDIAPNTAFRWKKRF